MKRIILAMCVFIALATADNAAALYRCVDKDGNSILTNNPPPGAKCESRGGDSAVSESTPRKGQRTKEANRANDTRSEVNAKIEDLIDKLSVQTYNSQGRPHSMDKNNAQIVELRKAQLRNQGNPQDAVRNQQDDLEDSMKRQQREMEDKTKAMNAQMIKQQADMQDLQHHQRMSEHNQRMQQFNQQMGR